MTNLDRALKNRDITLLTKGYGLPSGLECLSELDREEGRVPKN